MVTLARSRGRAKRSDSRGGTAAACLGERARGALARSRRESLEKERERERQCPSPRASARAVKGLSRRRRLAAAFLRARSIRGISGRDLLLLLLLWLLFCGRRDCDSILRMTYSRGAGKRIGKLESIAGHCEEIAISYGFY